MDARDKRGHDGRVVTSSFTLRPYREDDEDAAIALWRETWQQAYPNIDFAARVPWWRERWRNELVPKAAIIVAEEADRKSTRLNSSHSSPSRMPSSA